MKDIERQVKSYYAGLEFPRAHARELLALYAGGSTAPLNGTSNPGRIYLAAAVLIIGISSAVLFRPYENPRPAPVTREPVATPSVKADPPSDAPVQPAPVEKEAPVVAQSVAAVADSEETMSDSSQVREADRDVSEEQIREAPIRRKPAAAAAQEDPRRKPSKDSGRRKTVLPGPIQSPPVGWP